MKRFLYSVWNDVKKGKILNTLMFFEILFLILIVGMMFGLTETNANDLKLYDKKNDAVTFVAINENAKLKLSDYIGKEGFDDIALTSINQQQYISGGDYNFKYINAKAAELFKVPVKKGGKWFSAQEAPEWKEALVSKRFSSQFKIGQTYTLNDGSSEHTKIKIIGYLGSHDDVISMFAGGFGSLYGTGDFLVCNSSKINYDRVKTFASDTHDKEFFETIYQLKSSNYGDSYQQYYEYNFSTMYRNNCIMTFVLIITFLCILCNSIFKVERDINRNMLKFVVGNSNKDIVAAEVFKCSIIYIVPFLIDLAISLLVHYLEINKQIPAFIKLKNFFIAAVIVLGAYIISTIFGLIRTIKTDPLTELRRL